MSTVVIELPESVRESLEAQRQGLPRFALEAIAVAGYRQEALSRGQVGEMLGLSFWQTEEFLRTNGAYLHYDMQDFEQDLETAVRLSQKRP